MGCFYFVYTGLLFLLFIIKEINSITYRTENKIHRRHVSTNQFSDWELGLREAVNQVLLRDGPTIPDLRQHIINAPFLGKHHYATPFGDIAILARGQLYATPSGFKFLQDRYQNDCGECHSDSHRCSQSECGEWRPQSAEELVALWSVKRLRHRDEQYGHRYEIEYRVSPIKESLHGRFITRNGKFDYSIPGHVFVIKSDPKFVTGHSIHNKFNPPTKTHYKDTDQKDYHQPLPTYLVPHSIYPTDPSKFEDNIQGVKDPKEIELYKLLIESLASKTSTTNIGRYTPHRFQTYSTNYHTQQTNDNTQPSKYHTPSPTYQTQPNPSYYTKTPSYYTKTPSYQTQPQRYHTQPPSYHTTSPSYHNQAQSYQTQPQSYPTKPQSYHTQPPSYRQTTVPSYPTKMVLQPVTLIPLPPHTTLVQLPVSQTTATNQVNHHTTLKTNDLVFTPNHVIPQITFKPGNIMFTVNNIPPTTLKPNEVVFTTIFVPHTVQSTTRQEILTTGTTPSQHLPTTRPSTLNSPTFSSPKSETTKPTTFHYYSASAEEGHRKPTPTTKQTPSDYDDIFTTNIKPTKQKVTQTINEYDSSELDLFPIEVPTNPIKASKDKIPHEEGTTKEPFIIYPSSISEQIPLPNNDTETTIPYVPSSETVSHTDTFTIRQPTTLKSTTPISSFTNINTKTTFPTTILSPQYSTSTKESLYGDKTTNIVSSSSYTTHDSPTIATTELTRQTVLPKQTYGTQSSTKNHYYYTDTTAETLPQTVHATLQPTTVREEGSAASSKSSFYLSTLGHTLSMQTENDRSKKTSELPQHTQPVSRNTYESTEALPTTINNINEITSTGTTKFKKTMPVSSLTQTTHKSVSETIPTIPMTSSQPTTIEYAKSTTYKSQLSSSTKDDFLIDDTSDSKEIENEKEKDKNYDEEDIFGPTSTPVKQTTKKYLQEGYHYEMPKSTKDQNSKDYTTSNFQDTHKTPKIIYLNFFEASTASPTTSLDQFNEVVQEHTSIDNDLNNAHPSTQQSFETSISYKVNKKNKTNKLIRNAIQLEPTIMTAKLSEILVNDDIKIYKAEMPQLEKIENTTEKGMEDAKKVLDHLTLQLVNHAKSIDYFNQKQKRAKSAKYKRRHYDPSRKPKISRVKTS